MGIAQSTISRSLPWMTKFKLLVISASMDSVRRSNGTINRRLLSFLKIFNPDTGHSTVNGVQTADFSVDRAKGLWFRLFLPMDPATAASLPVLLFFHGGGFAFLSAAMLEYDDLCRRFCRELGVAVVSVNYRLSPEHRFPAQYDDGIDVLRFLESNDGKDFPLLREFFNVADLSTCFLAGDSAGANIAHHVARRWTAGVDCRVRIVGLIAIQPFFGGESRVDSELRLSNAPIVNIERTNWLWKSFLPGGATRDHPAASPVAAVEDLPENFPPVLVVVGEFDPLQDWQRMYLQSLRKMGKQAEIVEYCGAIHAFYVFPELKRVTALIEDMGGFILRQISRRRECSEMTRAYDVVI